MVRKGWEVISTKDKPPNSHFERYKLLNVTRAKMVLHHLYNELFDDVKNTRGKDPNQNYYCLVVIVWLFIAQIKSTFEVSDALLVAFGNLSMLLDDS
ncbi:unnamed protein product [Sphenostylis stenocarpa]|uniref:Uncharacterized protein n=1 Tax=Sphenostylis stenocarpa TaxID=92480 RepID=A0AA86VZH9_9FABA|nr:unnamed protein product [Sphenostylis stenocarpa]